MQTLFTSFSCLYRLYKTSLELFCWSVPLWIAAITLTLSLALELSLFFSFSWSSFSAKYSINRLFRIKAWIHPFKVMHSLVVCPWSWWNSQILFLSHLSGSNTIGFGGLKIPRFLILLRIMLIDVFSLRFRVYLIYFAFFALWISATVKSLKFLEQKWVLPHGFHMFSFTHSSQGLRTGIHGRTFSLCSSRLPPSGSCFFSMQLLLRGYAYLLQ